MRPSSVPPRQLLFCDTSPPEDFGARLEAFKEATGLTWEGLAACLGVDPRQLQRWRDGTRPSWDGVCALVKLAACIPGGLYTLLGVHVLPARRLGLAAAVGRRIRAFRKRRGGLGPWECSVAYMGYPSCASFRRTSPSGWSCS